MISLLDVLKDVTDRFNKIGLEYFLVGSLATMYYGRPRFTQDVDLVVRIKAKHVLTFESYFPIDDYYCPPVEVIQDELIRKGSFNLINQNSGIKIDIVIDQENDFYKSEFERRKKIEIAPSVNVYIASPEDLIIKKLEYYREGRSEKHLNDIRDIIMNTVIDEAYIQTWVNQLKLQDEWKEV